MFGISPKKLFTLLLFVAGVFVAVQYGSAYLTKYQFEDSVRQSVKYAASTRKGPEDVRREVVEKAHELGIDINPRDIQITKRGPAFTLAFEYIWTVNLRVTQHVLTFNISEQGEMFGP
jgi:hypothetical protein